MAEQDGTAIAVTGVGLVAPVGRDCASAAAAIRAGISRFAQLADFRTPTGGASVGATAYGLTDDLSGSDRLRALATPALQEAMYRAEEFYPSLDLAASRLILSLSPPERPVYEDFDSEDVAELLEDCELLALRPSLDAARAGARGVLPEQRRAAEAGQRELPPSVELLRDGHAGGVLALARAAELLRSGALRHCIVGGVDSLVEYPALQWLDEAGRVKTDDRPAGFVPGEAAAFLVLELASQARRRGAPILAELAGLASAHEEASVFSGKPVRGLALAEALRATLSEVGGGADCILCDLNGEYYRGREWALAMGRAFEDAPSVPELRHPAECIGDVGAASAVVLTALAVAWIARGYARRGGALVWSSSDSGARGSLLARAPESAG